MWKDIKNWENTYQISDSGDVRNKITGNIIKGDRNSSGYFRVCLYDKNHIPEKNKDSLGIDLLQNISYQIRLVIKKSIIKTITLNIIMCRI